MRTFKIRTVKLSAAALVFSLFFVACKPEPPEPPKNKCELTGKFTRQVCLPSIYNGYVILDEVNGRYLAPCESEVTIPQNIEEGQYVEYSYEEIPYGGECEKSITCNAIPDKPYKFVRLTCVKTKISIALE